MLLYQLKVSEAFINNKIILITGGTGSFGNQMVKTLLNYNPKKIIIFSRDEFKQYEMAKKFNPEVHQNLRYLIGDIRDYERLKFAFKNVNIVFHAAALKQVPAMEYNPSEAIKTNIYGAENIIRASIENNVTNVIAISTDKAVNPVNLYGATKMCFEKLFLAANNITGGCDTKFSVMRYGNVFGSRGSVIPLFLKQSKKNEFTVTDKNMTRFTMMLEDAINFVLNCSEKMIGGEIFIPKLPSYNIIQLAKVINAKAKITFIGIRPGEKIHESMIGPQEAHKTLNCQNYFIILQHTNFDKYISHYQEDFINIRKDGDDYNSGKNEYISDEKLKEMIELYN